MSTLRQLRASAQTFPPTGTMLLDPSAYAPEYPKRPSEPVAIGVKLLSETDVQSARAAAVKTAVDYVSDESSGLYRIEAYNDALLREIAARAATDPNDARVAYFPGDEEEVREALTSDGCRAIFDKLEQLAIEHCPLAPEASDDEIHKLAAHWMISSGKLPNAQQRRLRRLLGHVLKTVLDADEDENVTNED